MKKVILAAIFMSQVSQAEIIDLTGPHFQTGIGSTYYYLQLTVPSTVVGQCVENNGNGRTEIQTFKRYKNSNGKYSDIYGENLIGDEIFFKSYKCSYPILTQQEVENSKYANILIASDGFSHSYTIDTPENTDKDSTRYLAQTEDLFFFNPSIVAGVDTNDLDILKSLNGEKALYYQITTSCDARGTNLKPATSLDELNAICKDSDLVGKTQKHTFGPSQIMLISVDSTYYGGRVFIK